MQTHTNFYHSIAHFHSNDLKLPKPNQTLKNTLNGTTLTKYFRSFLRKEKKNHPLSIPLVAFYYVFL